MTRFTVVLYTLSTDWGHGEIQNTGRYLILNPHARAQALASLLYALRLHRLTYVAVRLEAGLSRGGGRGLTVCPACVSCAVLYEHRLLTSKCEAL